METYMNGIQKLPGDIYTQRGDRATLIHKDSAMEFTVALYKKCYSKVCTRKSYKTLSAAQKIAERFLSE
jgi:hypothetical protein